MFKQKNEPPASTVHVEPADAVQLARARARNRLIGAIVLLVVGIIGFPLVFETEPRPVPIDIPIEIPRREGLPPLSVPASRAVVPSVAPPIVTPPSEAAGPTPGRRASGATATAAAGNGVIVESSADAGRDVTPVRAAASATPIARPATPASVATAPSRAPSAAASSAAPANADDGARALALLEGRAGSAAAASRYIVQIGAFADAESAQKARKQAEHLGLKTYTQIAQTTAGSRIRVRLGPFASRAEADAAQARARAAGIAADVLAL